MIGQKKIVISILLADCPADFDEASWHVGEAHMTRNGGGLWATAKNAIKPSV